MRRILFVFVILITLVIFPDRSWLCQPANAPVPVVTNPCDHFINLQPLASAVGISAFSLLAPTVVAVSLHVHTSPLLLSPLLTPEELVQRQIDPPPRSITFS